MILLNGAKPRLPLRLRQFKVNEKLGQGIAGTGLMGYMLERAEPFERGEFLLRQYEIADGRFACAPHYLFQRTPTAASHL